ncbi:MAG: hypothetical protein J6Y24_15150 [Bacteroidales bacterium]|nr:hypothetical protein [Bacteroidales bacterium]
MMTSPTTNISTKTEIPTLKNFIVDNVEKVSDVYTLQRICAIIISNSETYEQKFRSAKLQTEKYCPKELAEELEAEGFMIGKPFPVDNAIYDLQIAEKEDSEDEPVPEEWLQKMFPEVYA